MLGGKRENALLACNAHSRRIAQSQGNKIMNTDDLNFAYKVRHALNEQLDTLPASTTDRLAAARQAALVTATAGAGGRFFASQPFPWLTRLSVIIPLLVLVIGMGGIYHHEQQRRIAEIAELDAAVLSDELPLSAYLDHGFNAYLANQSEQ